MRDKTDAELAEEANPADYSTVVGVLAAAKAITEKLAMDISAAYEEMDGVRRPMSTPMGKLLHEGNGAMGQLWTAYRLVQRHHDEALAAMRDDLLARAAAEVSLHARLVGSWFNLVCKCGHRGTAVSYKGEFEQHVEESILALATPTVGAH
jgi:hypothetical protein